MWFPWPPSVQRVRAQTHDANDITGMVASCSLPVGGLNHHGQRGLITAMGSTAISGGVSPPTGGGVKRRQGGLRCASGIAWARPLHGVTRHFSWRLRSWFDFGGQLREKGHITVEFLRQATDNCLGRDHLAVDHSKQLYRVHAQLRTELEYIRAPGHAKISDVGAEPVWFRGHGHFRKV
jgi:hypothetical protein